MSNKLLWELFEMVRELMPANEANNKRLSEWSAKFHAVDAGSEAPPVHVADDDDDDDEPADDPHEHGSPARHKVKRRR